MDLKQIEKILEQVVDPEIPVLTISDIGILRGVEIQDDKIIVTITPTYVGCPAMGVIEEDILSILLENGIDNAEVKSVLSPAWTTDWITQEAKDKLEAYGIAPPVGTSLDKSILTGAKKEIGCPQCKSTNTEMISHFGSTACKSLYKCLDCLEPFDYFKCL